MEEIFSYVYWEIKRSGFEKKLIAGLVLTGGGSLLKHVNLLAEYETGLSCRKGQPIEHLAMISVPTDGIRRSLLIQKNFLRPPQIPIFSSTSLVLLQLPIL